MRESHLGCLLVTTFIFDHNVTCSFMQVPEEARELEKELRQITKEKNEAVRGQDFEKVYCLDLVLSEFFVDLGNNKMSYEM